MSMKPFDETTVQKAAALKAYRTAIRLKYALMADEEIARTLPEVEERINWALSLGKPLELSIGKVFDEV